MSASVAPMPLVTAQRRAESIVTWLMPYCERIEVAGSIRRERPICNDIDLVVIPKVLTRPKADDLLRTEMESVNLLRTQLIGYVRAHPGRAMWKGRTGEAGPEPRADAMNLLLVTSKGVQLDVWCATPANWTTLLICRTGSMLHNVWAAERAKALRGHWNPYQGLRLRGEDVALHCEDDFYRALSVEPIPPRKRERDFLNRVWNPSAASPSH